MVAVIVALAGACTGGGDAETAAEDEQRPAPQDQDAGQPAVAGGFEANYSATTERYADALTEVQDSGIEAVTRDPVGAHEVYERLREVTEDARADLAALSPPDDVADEHARVVELLEQQVEALAGAVAASRTRDDRTLETSLAHYAELLAEWREAHGGLSSRLEGS